MTNTTTPSDPTTATNAGPGGITADAPTAAANKLHIDLWAHQLVNQPALTALTAVPDLGQHLTDAQAHANQWIGTTSGTIIDRLTAIDGFSQVFLALVPKLITASQNASTDPTQSAALLKDIQWLSAKVVGYEADALQSATDLHSLETLLNADVANFAGDEQLATKQYGKDGTAITNQKAAMANLQDTMSKFIAGIGGSAALAVIGGVVIFVGAVGEIFTAGVDTPIVAAGVAMTVAGVAGASALGALYAKALQSYSDLAAQVAQEQAEMTQLLDIQGKVNAVSAATSTAASDMDALAASWTALKGYLVNVATALQSAPDDIPEGMADTDLIAAQNDWQQVSTTVNGLVTAFQIPQVTVDLTQYPQMNIDEQAAA